MSFVSNPYTLHIALATYPYGYGKHCTKYIEAIKDSFYKGYRDKAGSFFTADDNPEKEDSLYQPLVYHLFGGFDLAFIAVTDSFKFAQKLPLPQGGAFSSNSFQIITGICPKINEPDKLQKTFRQIAEQKPLFVSIINLKLKSSILIGNGQLFIESVMQLIDQVVVGQNLNSPTIHHLLMQSFSWAEISLLIFSNDPNDFSAILSQLRQKRIKHLTDADSFVKNSVFEAVFNQPNIKEASIFADTNSYFGVDYEQFSNLESTVFKDICLPTQIEWQLKSGQANQFRKVLEDNFNGVFDLKKAHSLAGKSDFYVSELTENFTNNQKVFQDLISEDSKLLAHIRRIKTRILFPDASFGLDEEDNQHPLESFNQKLKELVISTDKIRHIDSQLKALKVSRQMREKVIKICYNFNSAIQDPVLFIYFLDFVLFIKRLLTTVENEHMKLAEFFNDNIYLAEISSKNPVETDTLVDSFESILKRYIDVFEEGHQIRMLNTYQFEEISDFDLDFNGSVQQLLTIYNSLIIHIGILIYPKGNFGPVVQINQKNTVGSLISINYNVAHLTSPEFVFFTILKEILNSFPHSDLEQEISPIRTKFYEKVQQVIRENAMLKDLYELGVLDFDYYVNDGIRFLYTSGFDIKLFDYWFWSFNFQNASLYNQVGVFDKKYLKNELFRLTFLHRLYGFTETLECPLPELQGYWDTWCLTIEDTVTVLFKDNESIQDLRSHIYDLLQKAYDEQIVKSETSSFWNKATQYTTPIEFTDETPNTTRFAIQGLKHRYGLFYETYFGADKDLNQGKRVFFSQEKHGSTMLFTLSLMNAYLRHLYEQNGSKIKLLRRNWENGTPLKIFIDSAESTESPYYVDQFGGVFFANNSKTTPYFITRNAVVQSLWHVSLLLKKEFMETQLASNEQQ